MSVDAHSGDAQNTTISADDAENLLEFVVTVLNHETRLHTETGDTTHKNREFSLIDVKRQLETLTDEAEETVDLSNITPLKPDMEKPAREALVEYVESNDGSLKTTETLTGVLKDLSTKV